MNMNPESDFPDPMLVEKMAEDAPPKVPLRDYLGAMQMLRAKRYSYQEIADWISEILGTEVKRNQISYLLNAPPEVLEADELQERMEDEDEQEP